MEYIGCMCYGLYWVIIGLLDMIYIGYTWSVLDMHGLHR